jgi:hypothetical protein
LWAPDYPKNFRNSLPDLLDLIRPHPRFDRLASKPLAFVFEYQKRYTSKVKEQVLRWEAKPWTSLTGVQLTTWESLLPKSRT